MFSLEKYNEKRKFGETPEPEGKTAEPEEKNRFVIQKHMARREHYDFRLQVGQVLVSWAIPKKPVSDPSVKRLAVQVEDHPLDYIHFEGNIPKGNYGAGTVMVWDIGYYYLDEEKLFPTTGEMKKRLSKGHLKLYMQGSKLKGWFNLVRSGKSDKEQWFFMKSKTEDDPDNDEDRSALTGRTMEEIAGSAEIWESNRKTTGKAPEAAEAPGSGFPGFVEPMLASLTDKAFSKSGWIYELKLDGYRVIAAKDEDETTLYSRRGNSYSGKYHLIAKEVAQLNASFVMDGEVCYIGSDGRSNFQKLQHNAGEQEKLHYYVFDLLWLNGHDLKTLPVTERKKLLKVLLSNPPSHVHYLEHRETDGKAYFKEAEKQKLEGIIAKKADGHYFPGERSKEWLKIKTAHRQEMVICGYTASDKAKRAFRSLLFAVHEDGSLTYSGKAGTGFNEQLMKEILQKLKPLETKKPPIKNPPAEKNVHWVKPELVGEVVFSEMTNDHLMRHPRFIGLRSDKEPEEVVLERPMPVEEAVENEPEEKSLPAQEAAENESEENKMEKSVKTKASTRASRVKGKASTPVKEKASKPKDDSNSRQQSRVKLTNLHKLYWKKEKITKKEVIDYYRDISEIILPYLKDRPQSLFRTPDGADGKGFFQKNMKDLAPEWARTIELESGTGETIEYLLCQDLDTLLYMVNLGCIEINPWSSSLPNLDHPDYMVFDLDPVEVDFSKVVELALKFKELFDQLGLPAFCKTSGSRGMHLFVPVQQRYSYDQVQAFVKAIESHIHAENPELTSFERSPSERRGKVYFDYLQNAKGKTMSVVYSLRPRPGALVSAPVRWEELTPKLTPQAFTIRNMRKRIEKEGDLWKGIFDQRVDMEKALSRIQH